MQAQATWNVATNWTPTEIPDTQGEAAVIPTGTVNMNISPTLDFLQVTGGTLNLGGNTLTLLQESGSSNSSTIVANAGTSR